MRISIEYFASGNVFPTYIYITKNIDFAGVFPMEYYKPSSPINSVVRSKTNSGSSVVQSSLSSCNSLVYQNGTNPIAVLGLTPP